MLLPLLTEWVEMERRIKSQVHGKNIKAFLGKKEKKCNKCGFVTFCLHVLYNHKYKCRGQLLGHPISCSFCHRKFNFFVLFKSHKRTCVKKILRQKLLKAKFRQKHLKYPSKKAKTSYDFSLSCPICHLSFKSKFKFVHHLKKQKCTSQPANKKGYSARKSISNHKRPKDQDFSRNENLHLLKSKGEKYFSPIEKDEHLCCLWCKSTYPSKKLLFMHVESSKECTSAYYQSSLFKTHKVSRTARKTISVVAKKSFPQRKHKTINDSSKNYSVSRSARKSLTTSRGKLKIFNKAHSYISSSLLNQCPVCLEEFPDSYAIFKHQKMKNHWGKATKSFGTTYECPFCNKEFLHLKSRNAHVQYHSDKDENEIVEFLRNITCNICFKSFASEHAKQQHEKIEHPMQMSDMHQIKYASGSEANTPNDSDYASKQKMSSVPSSVKKKLKQQPNTCPVCSKAFSHTVLRNKHFNEVHLKIFECQFCNTKFKSTSSLSNHIQLSHGKTVQCPNCKMMFSNEIELLEHALQSHPNADLKSFLTSKPIKDVLSKEKWQDVSEGLVKRNTEKLSFSNNAVYKRNMEYYCDVCNMGYQKLCGLQRHRQSKLHKDTLIKNLDAVQKSLSDVPSPSPPLPRSVKQPEILTCSECSEDFTNIKDFVPHRLSHFSVHGKYLRITELNPYMCEICSDVLDSHSKVQLHLFWHLQIESTANSNTSTYKASGKNDTIVPDRLSGQHVAKKSFSKQGSESFQEVVIGGVKKPLFTCEACNIGFTTKSHYNMHVRKLCRKKTANEFAKGATSENPAGSRRLNNTKKSENIVHCISCNCLFSSSAKHDQHKEFCVKCVFDGNSGEIVSNLDAIKTALNIDIAVAGCVTCGAIFDTVSNIASHLNIHQASGNKRISENILEDIIHCALCNCLFSVPAFKYHKDFCKIPLNCACKAINSKHMNVLKSALELKCAVAGCVSCGLPFEDLEMFSKHLMLHQTNQIQSVVLNRSSSAEGEVTFSKMNDENENSLIDNTSDFFINDLAEKSFETDNHELSSSYKTVDSINNSSISLTKATNNQSPNSSQKENKSSTILEELRNNFSQLLCLLISDTEIMLKLGYGKQLVDDVLINVLQQMGHKPFTDNKASDIDKLRKNIQILLDLCIKDQIMQLIGNGKTTDEMVTEALKIFTADDLSASEDISTT